MLIGNHPDCRAILDSARANPDSDLARLVLADWLREHGNAAEYAWGELMQLQCELAQNASDQELRWQQKCRENELIRKYSSTWLGSPNATPGKYVFRRGLIDARLSFLEFICPETVARLESIGPWFASLHLESVRRDHLPILGTARHLRLFYALDLSANMIGDAGLHLLSKAWEQTQLSRLSLASNVIGPRGIEYLVSTRQLRGLRELDLSNNSLRDSGVEVLSDWPVMRGLVRLNLAFNGLSLEGVQHLNNARFRQLSELQLSGNDLGNNGASALADSECLSQLRVLNLSFNHIGDAGAIALATSPYLTNLEKLNLGHNLLTNLGIDAIRSSPYLPKLKQLQLSLIAA